MSGALSSLSALSTFSSFLEMQDGLREAAALFEAGRYAEARAALEAEERTTQAGAGTGAGSVFPVQARVRIAHALGVVALRLGDEAEAGRRFDEALALGPNDAETHADRAMLRIASGEHREGFAEYEWRLLHPTEPCVLRRHVRSPFRRWEGEAIPPGEGLLVHAEQGLGDTLLFLRHLPELRRRLPGVPIRLALPHALRRLVAEAFLKERPEMAPCDLVTFREPLPAGERFRRQIPLLSLPFALGLEGESLFVPQPCLAVPKPPANPGRPGPRPRIGLVWRAGAESEGGRYRSLALQDLVPLSGLRAEWIGLQRETTPGEMALLHEAFAGRDASPACRDFLDTAQLFSSLDLLVTNDTAAAHLAGALGLPAFVLLPFAASWRWPSVGDGTRSPWHPSLRLFRQTANNDWTAPVAALRAALEDRFAGRWPTAEESFRAPRAPTPPEDRELALLAAQELHEKGDAPGVRRVLEACAVRHPDHAPLLRALGMARAETGDAAGALRLLRRANRLEPTNREVRFSLATFRLARRNFRKGFADYEARFDRPNCVEPRCVERTYWDGRTLDASKPLLVHCEQGLGDAIQFIRFLPWARERAAAIHLACSAPLLPLFRASSVAAGLAGYVTDGDMPPAHACHCPLLSLPRLMGLRFETVSAAAAIPYLEAPGLAPARKGGPLRVGLVWKSRLAAGTGRSKSLPLEALLPLAERNRGVEWVSLQREATGGETALLEKHFGIAPGGPADLGPTFPDFAALARAVAGLDLVISCDTAAAHLAGAMGKPVWVPLSAAPDWRWLVPGVNPDGDDKTPWYPTMRLFRQGAHGEWSGPVEAMAEALATLKG